MTKFIKFFFLLIFFLPLVSCSSDKDDSPEGDASIIGVWKQGSGDKYSNFTFDKKGNFSKILIDVEDGNKSSYGTYTVNNNILTLCYNDYETEVYTILSLTKSKLVTRYEGEYVGQYSYDDEIEEWTRVK